MPNFVTRLIAAAGFAVAGMALATSPGFATAALASASLPSGGHAAPAASSMQDVVHYASPSAAGGVRTYHGEVLSYTGEQLVIRLSTGEERTLAGGDSVLSIETTYADIYGLAEENFAAGEYQQAHDLYSDAFTAENRPWVQRLILRQMVYCMQNLNRWEAAGRDFLLLTSSDRRTPYFECIPLGWVPGVPSPTLERAATGWLQSTNSVARLLGASHLFSSSRAAAQEALLELRFDADHRVAALARMQLWRTEAHSADRAQINLWKEDLEGFPRSLQAGGYFVIGLAAGNIHLAEESATSLMRVPIHFPQQRRLGARCLMESGRQLEELGRANEASRLYTELIDHYPAFPESREAEQRLKAMAEDIQSQR